MDPKTDLFVAEGISKSFGITKAVADFSIGIGKGEIRGLVGENGSGKSTFASVVAGVYKRETGRIHLDGEEYSASSSVDAAAKGVSIIMQEIATIENITVAANIFLNRESEYGKYGLRSERTLMRAAKKLLDELGFAINPTMLTGALNLEERKLIELAKAMSTNPKLLIVDETSNALTRVGREHLYRCVHKVTDAGGAVLFITHDMDELVEMCGSVTIMRDGHYVDTLYGKDMDINEIKKRMVGREIAERFYRTDFTPTFEDDIVLTVSNICTPTADNLSVELHKGEILGIGGLSDSGMHEFARVLFGLDKVDSGTVTVHKDGVDVNIASPVTAIENGVAYLSKNRDTEALIVHASINDNICLPRLKKLRKHGLILHRDELEHAKRYADSLEIKMTEIDQFCSELSGGNKQKVVLAKWLGNNSKIFIMDCPTRGIDIGVKEKIYRMMEELKAQGHSIVMISEELRELIGMSDRVLIMKTHRVVAELERNETLDEREIIELMI